MRQERSSTPSLRHLGAQTMCNVVPCTGARRKVAHRHLQPGIMRPWLERTFPYSCATAMTPTPIGHDASRFGFGIHHAPHVVPPSLETGARQCPPYPDHPPRAPRPHWGSRRRPQREAPCPGLDPCNQTPAPSRVVLLAAMPAHSCVLLGIDREERLLTGLTGLDWRVDVVAWRRAVRRLRAFTPLAVGLSAII